MRTETFLMIRKSCIRQKLRDVLQWPIKISQFLGCFPFQLNSNNEFVLQWNGYPMICTIIWFFANLILITYYFMNKEEIVNDIMGGFTNTENYASSLISGLILIIDKFMTIYSIVLRKYTIKFQARLNKVFEYIVNEVDNSNSSLPPSTCILRNPYSYIEKESKCVRKIGMIFLALGLVFEITSALFHSARLFNPTSDIFKKIALMVVCTLGQCSLTIPKLCYLYYLSSIICLFKGGFLMMKDITKHLSNCCGSLVDGREISDNEKNWINLLLEMHSKLEKLVVKYNQAFGLQLLGCMIISLVLITGYSFLICANIRFNFWYVMVVAIPLTAVHCLTLTFLCHNASYMTILAQKTILKLRHCSERLNPDQSLKVILYYTKAVSSPPAICPLNFIAINYQTLISAFTIITTYLFVLLQFRDGEDVSCNRQRPNCFINGSLLIE